MGARVFCRSFSGGDPRWLRWHHLYGWLSKAEFTLGLALALYRCHGSRGASADRRAPGRCDRRSAVGAQLPDGGRARPRFTPAGYCFPSHAHLAAGGIALFKSRQRISEILRIVPGSSLVVAPSDRDLAAPEMAAGLEKSLAAAVIPRCSARLCCKWPGITSHRRSMAVNRPSSCMPAAAWPIGAVGCAGASKTIISWPMRCSARSICRCRKST